MPNREESSLVTIDTGFRPAVPADAGALMKQMGVTDVAVIANYKITSAQQFKEAGVVVVQAAQCVAAITSGYKDEKAKAHSAHAQVCANEKTDLAPFLKIREVGESAIRCYAQELERLKREEEDRQRREAEEAERQARVEAQRLEREAAAKAEQLRQAGAMQAAREAEALAKQQGAEIVQQAEQLAEIGVIVADNKPKVAGLGESRPWVGVIDNPGETIMAVAAGLDNPFNGVIDELINFLAAKMKTEDEIPARWRAALAAYRDSAAPLIHVLPRRGGGVEELSLLEVNQVIVTNAAKRMQRTDIGLAGCHGDRDFGLRVSTKGAPAPAPDSKAAW